MTDLDALIARVEHGDWHFGICRAALGPSSDIRYAAKKAYLGSLDAAARLHGALLPGMFWNMGCLDMPSLGYVCTVAEGHFADSPTWRGYAMNPARAWLLAILHTLKAKGDAE